MKRAGDEGGGRVEGEKYEVKIMKYERISHKRHKRAEGSH